MRPHQCVRAHLTWKGIGLKDLLQHRHLPPREALPCACSTPLGLLAVSRFGGILCYNHGRGGGSLLFGHNFGLRGDVRRGVHRCLRLRNHHSFRRRIGSRRLGRCLCCGSLHGCAVQGPQYYLSEPRGYGQSRGAASSRHVSNYMCEVRASEPVIGHGFVYPDASERKRVGGVVYGERDNENDSAAGCRLGVAVG